jgi:hypothetical protein
MMHSKASTYTPGLLVHYSDVLETIKGPKQIFQQKLRLAKVKLANNENMMQKNAKWEGYGLLLSLCNQ